MMRTGSPPVCISTVVIRIVFRACVPVPAAGSTCAASIADLPVVMSFREPHGLARLMQRDQLSSRSCGASNVSPRRSPRTVTATSGPCSCGARGRPSALLWQPARERSAGAAPGSSCSPGGTACRAERGLPSARLLEPAAARRAGDICWSSSRSTAARTSSIALRPGRPLSPDARLDARRPARVRSAHPRRPVHGRGLPRGAPAPRADLHRARARRAVVSQVDRLVVPLAGPEGESRSSWSRLRRRGAAAHAGRTS